ncbi:hypothetical protein E2C01_085146 [Portunus trituberculatus]|uniref:N-acetyltransferase domain-containing protein n=1 Tax=Portunus trituberculatus TaxID=210409 RepID=A0A5B7J1U2_PORTR|nr:hypothetical protein [Portunus trituberculatus]
MAIDESAEGRLFLNFELLNVDKAYGGRGIASMLVQQSCNVARTQGFTCLVAETTGKRSLTQ